MRFFANGPSIPHELLVEHENGNVVFFCGAGVSLPAGLPNFLNLAKKVINDLGSPADSKARFLLERSGPDSESAPPLDQVFTLLQQEYGDTYIETIVSDLLKTPPKADTSAHATILRLSRNPNKRLQLVTTNFDLLFERAEKKVNIYIPPTLPDLASEHALDGLVYLHGRRSNSAPFSPIRRQGLVLSSADFGRAYLADGWATRFVRDLLSRYVIVLVGYSANDPPVRYLLEGLHSRKSAHAKTIYAFDEGPPNEVQSRWRDRGVRALSYSKIDQNHSGLWDTLRAWADRAEDKNSWYAVTIEKSRSGPRELQPFERGQVISMLRDVSGAKAFAAAMPSPPAEWLCVMDKYARYADEKPARPDEEGFDPLANYGLDDDPPRALGTGRPAAPAGDDFLSPLQSDERVDNKRLVGISHDASAPLPMRLLQISHWFTKVIDQPAAVWWTAGYEALHPHLLRQIEWRLDREGALDETSRKVWGLMLEAHGSRRANNRDLSWYEFIPRLKVEGWSSRVLRDFEQTARPYLKVKRPLGSGPQPPKGGWDVNRVSNVVSFEVEFPVRSTDKLDIPSDVLPAVVAALRRGLEIGASLLGDIGDHYWRTATFHPTGKRSEHLSDSDAYLLWFVRLFDRLSAENAWAARAEVDQWPENDFFFFSKLKIYALMNDQLFDGNDTFARIVAVPDDGFWAYEAQRELLYTLRARWPDFGKRQRERIEKRILAGPSKWPNEKKIDYKKRKAGKAAEILGWLSKSGCKLSATTKTAALRLQKIDKQWNPAWIAHADDAHEITGGFIATNADPSKIIDAPTSEVIALAKENSKREWASLTQNDPFRGLVERRPVKALSALRRYAQRNEYPVEFWRRALSHWPETTPPRLRCYMGRWISSLPAPVMVDLRYYVPDWCKKNLPKLAVSSPEAAFGIWDAVVENFSESEGAATKSSLGEMSVGGVPVKRSRRTYEHSINSPIGRLTETLFDILIELKAGKETGIPISISARLEKLFSMPGEGADHAVCECGRQLIWLNYLDEAWCRKNVLPFFEVTNHFAEPAWNGYLHDNRMASPRLFATLKPNFLKLFRLVREWDWGGQPTGRLHDFLVVGCLWRKKNKSYISYAEARTALQTSSDEGRAHTAWFLSYGLKEENIWKEFTRTFILKAWPLEARFRTSDVSRSFSMMAEKSGENFPDVVRTILPILVPVNHFDILLHGLEKDDTGARTIPQNYPEPLLALLDRLTPLESDAGRSYYLGEILNDIVSASPELRQDSRWRRLNDLLNHA